MTSPRVLVADDHDVVRSGLRGLLEAEGRFEICAGAADGREAVSMAARLKPDVVVMDIAMPNLNGLEATREILKAAPRTEVLILSVHESDQLVREVLEAGARGYVLKSDAGRLLIEAVESLAAHRPFFSGKISERLLAGFLSDAGRPDSPSGGLTLREREVLQLIAEGHSSKEIARLLGIGLKTVETHRANIMAKLDMHSVAELVRFAIRNRIIEP